METRAIRNTDGIRNGKRVVMVSITRKDQYRVGQEWHSAAEITHDTSADEVRHFGRHTTLKGDVMRIESIVSGAPIDVEILSIRAVEVSKLTPESFVQMGYINRADFMADDGKIVAEKAWIMAIKPVPTTS
jgi:hypothetical protein